MADELDDLDMELLAVAGRAKAPPRKRTKGRQAGSDSEDVESEDEDSDLFGSDSDEDRKRSKKRAAPKRAQGGGKKPRTSSRRNDDDEDEDGEASDDDDDDGDEDGYGSDLYIDEEDRRKLEAMTELEREMILADRAEERDKQRQRRALLKKAKGVDADRSEPRYGNRLSGRQKRATADKDSAIKRIEAARQRQEKGARAREEAAASGGRKKDTKRSGRRGDSGSDEDEDEKDSGDEFRPSDEEDEEEGDRRGGRRDARGRDDDEEEEEEEEEDRVAPARGEVQRGALGEHRAPEPQRLRDEYASDEDVEDEDAQYEDIKTVQIRRTQLQAWYDKPIFTGEGLFGCVVRMAYGAQPQQVAGATPYMMMTVRDVKEGGRPYAFGPKGGMCAKYLVLADGMGLVHTMQMANVSDKDISPEEFARYHRHTQRAQITMLKRRDVEDARLKIAAMAAYRWDSGKVKEELERKRAQGQLPVNIAAEKSRLKRLLEGAQSAGRVEEVAAIEGQLRDLDSRSLADKGGDKRTYGMSHINKRNQQMNFMNAIKKVSNKPAGAVDRKSGVDPFSRRQTRPNIYWNTKAPGGPTQEQGATQQATPLKVDTSGAHDEAGNFPPETPRRGAPSPGTAQTLLGGVVGRKLGPALLKLDPLELVKMLTLDVTVDRLAEGSVAPSLPKRMLGTKWAQGLGRGLDLSNKTIMTVADWKRRAGYM